MRSHRPIWIAVWAALAVCCHAQAITISFDYSYDTNDFFTTNPDAVGALEAAAEAYSGFLDDLEAIEPGGGSTWKARFTHPGTGAVKQVNNLLVPADTLIVYAGGRNMPDPVLAEAGPGGYMAVGSPTWLDTVAYRGETGAALPSPTDFGPWGGSVSFDTNTSWNFGIDTGPAPGEADFFSVAVHEIAHILGFGTSDSWDARLVASEFIGPVSTTVYGGNVPISSDAGHWAEDTIGYIYRTPQEAAMAPSIYLGTRKLFTILDYAGLIDVGWAYPPPGDTNADGAADGADFTVWADNLGATDVPPASQGGWTVGNFNEDGNVDGADYTLWADHYQPAGSAPGAAASGADVGAAEVVRLANSAAVPEPATLSLLPLGACLALLRRRS